MLGKRNPLALAARVRKLLNCDEETEQRIAKEVFLPESDYGNPFIATDFVRASDREACDKIIEQVAGLKPNGDALAQLHSPTHVKMENGGKRWHAVVVHTEVRKGRYCTIHKKTKWYQTQTEVAIAVCELVDGKRDYAQ